MVACTEVSTCEATSMQRPRCEGLSERTNDGFVRGAAGTEPYWAWGNLFAGESCAGEGRSGDADEGDAIARVLTDFFESQTGSRLATCKN